MKSHYLIIAALAVSSAFVSCRKFGSETYTSLPSYVITTDESGAYKSKKDYSYGESGETLTQKIYKWSGSEWTLEHDCVYNYEYGDGNVLKSYTVVDNGAPAFRYDYAYGENGLLAYQKVTEYGLEEKITENQYQYEMNNGYVRTKYTLVPDVDLGKWVESTKESYERNSEGLLTLSVTSVMGKDGYEDTLKVYYTYVNGLVSKFNVQKKVGGSWATYQDNTYSYDSHGRVTIVSIEVSNLEVSPVTTTKTTEIYQYPD